jgi:hypothetical protein
LSTAINTFVWTLLGLEYVCHYVMANMESGAAGERFAATLCYAALDYFEFAAIQNAPKRADVLRVLGFIPMGMVVR